MCVGDSLRICAHVCVCVCVTSKLRTLVATGLQPLAVDPLGVSDGDTTAHCRVCSSQDVSAERLSYSVV